MAETVDPEVPIKEKGEPTEHFITEMFTTEATQDEMAGLIVMSDPSDATDAHYVDVPRGVTVYNRECNCPQRTCIVEAVTSYLNVLKSNDSPLAENRCHL